MFTYSRAIFAANVQLFIEFSKHFLNLFEKMRVSNTGFSHRTVVTLESSFIHLSFFDLPIDLRTMAERPSKMDDGREIRCLMSEGERCKM